MDGAYTGTHNGFESRGLEASKVGRERGEERTDHRHQLIHIRDQSSPEPEACGAVALAASAIPSDSQSPTPLRSSAFPGSQNVKKNGERSATRPPKLQWIIPHNPDGPWFLPIAGVGWAPAPVHGGGSGVQCARRVRARALGRLLVTGSVPEGRQYRPANAT